MAPLRSTFAKLDMWLEEQNVLNELTQAPRTQMEGTLSPEQKEVGGPVIHCLSPCVGSMRRAEAWCCTAQQMCASRKALDLDCHHTGAGQGARPEALHWTMPNVWANCSLS